MSTQRLIPILLALFSISCASAPRPVLYPNEYLEEVGKSQSQKDIEACRQKADDAGAHRDPSKVTKSATDAAKGATVGAAAGAAGGAVGSVGRGAGIGAAAGGAAALTRSMFSKPPVAQAHKNFVDRCLREEGYEPIGWQ